MLALISVVRVPDRVMPALTMKVSALTRVYAAVRVVLAGAMIRAIKILRVPRFLGCGV